MTKISGGKRFGSTLRSLRQDSPKEIRRALETAGGIIATEAKLSITEGSVSGKNHVPSAPGEPPNADTNELDESIGVRVIDDFTVEVYADAPHAVAQEFGAVIEDGFGKGVTIVLDERPYMRPAAQQHGPKASQLIGLAITTIIRRKGA